jgi:Dopey, N-terminal
MLSSFNNYPSTNAGTSQVLSLLDKLSETVSPAFFFQSIWLILLTTPSARGPALNYLSRRLPALIGDDGMLLRDIFVKILQRS